MAYHDIIKQIRINECLSQIEFAKLIGVSRSSVLKYENGKGKPRLSIIPNLIELAKKQGHCYTADDFLK